MAKDNLSLWNRVCETNPDHTKGVNQRGGFTAIDQMSQIRAATEQFGPAGKGWGWSTSDPIYPGNDTVVIKVTLWHGSKDSTVEQFGQKALGKGRADEDAFKKCVTDGLTKCLSYLGFNADVFLGRFDDHKYVEDMRSKFREPEPEPEHSEGFKKHQRRFFAVLDESGVPYEDLKAYCLSRKDKLEPKFMSEDRLLKMIEFLSDDEGSALIKSQIARIKEVQNGSI